MTEAYRLQPDSADGAEIRQLPEEWKRIKQFEVWWEQLPEPAGSRPVLPLSRDDAYSYLSKFIAVEITSTVRGIASEIVLGEQEGLSRVCVANCDSLRTVPRMALTRCAGQLAPERRIEVKRAMGAALGWRELKDLE